MPKRDFLPKDMRDLEDIFYNPDNAERKRKYESFIDTKFMDKIREAEAKRIMNKFGKSIKISTLVGIKTPDFRIEESKIVFEVTSIKCSEKERMVQTIKPRQTQKVINKINKAIEHAAEKDYSEYRDYQKVLIIFIDTILAALCGYDKLCSIPDIIRKTTFLDSDVISMILAPLPSSMSGELSYTAYTKTERSTRVLRENLPKEFTVFNV